MGTADEEGDVDVDVLCLTDAVEAADALLEEFGVERQVEEDEVVGEEATSLFSDAETLLPATAAC